MSKLTLEEIAPYLPYKVTAIDEYNRIRTVTIEHDTYDTKTLGFKRLFDHDKEGVYYHKLLLRSLSDLTDEMIEDLYFQFEREVDASTWESQLRQMRKYGGTRYALPREWWNYLYKHQFDINNLIGQNKAIDINTIQH